MLVGLSILIFCMARLVPGDPAELALGTNATEEAKELYRQENHLYEPIYTQYWYWLTGALHGDLGESTQTKRAVALDIQQFLPATLELVFFAMLVEITVGLAFGILSARYAGKWVDNIVKVFSYFGIALPSFVVAVLLMLLLCYVWPVLPAIGRVSTSVARPETMTGLYMVDSLLQGNWACLKDSFLHLILPAISLAGVGIAQSARITRTNMVENMGKDYVSAEISAGIPMRKVVLQYVLRPSCIPTVSYFAMDAASMLGVSFAVEKIFNYPGLARYCLNALLNMDLNAIVGTVMVFGIAFLLVNILVDILSVMIDPRIGR